MSIKLDERCFPTYKDRILSVLPVNGEKVQAKEIYKNAKFPNAKNPIPRAYVAKYLKELVASGIVEKIEESRKNVYYRRCENVRLNLLISNFFSEIQTSLSELPNQLSTFKNNSKEEAIEVDVTTLSENERYLKAYILLVLIDKAHELLEMEFPELKNFYMRTTKRDLHIVSEEMFDRIHP